MWRTFVKHIQKRRPAERAATIPSPRTAKGRRRSERGYVFAITAFSIVGLTASAALAVDVSGWYVQAAEVQRASDNAALAGVVWLPDMTKATTEARAVAKENGFEHGVNGTSVLVKRKGRFELQVDIKTPGHLYFGQAFLENVNIGRRSKAHYTLAAPLGSPESAMGLNTQVIGDFGPQQYWLALNGFCKGREQGDLISSQYQANGDRCPPDPAAWATAQPNGDYDPEGYWFVVDVPAGGPAIDVQVYDAGECFLSAASGWGDPPPIEWTLYGADNTPLDDTDNAQFGNVVTDVASGCDAYTTVFTIPSGAKEGRWLLNAKTRASDVSTGLNRFGLWAKRSTDSQPCDQLVEQACPRVYARDRIPMLVWGAAEPTFYLVDIAPDHGGKELVVSLFDSAEGMESIQLLDPAGNPVPFTWETADGEYGPSANDQCAEGPCLRVDVTGNWLVPGQMGGWYGTPSNQDKFNNRVLELHINLPDKSTLESFSNTWWRLRYKTKAGAVATDRTTWSVALHGDPVKLSG